MKLILEREQFCTLIEQYNLVGLLMDKLDIELSRTENFLFFADENEDVSIISRNLDEQPKIINWYKKAHIGRCLNLWGFESEAELESFLATLKDDLEREK